MKIPAIFALLAIPLALFQFLLPSIIASLSKSSSSNDLLKGKLSGAFPSKNEFQGRVDFDVSESRPDYYVVFSTSCTPQQAWESYLLFYHAMKVKQPGNVTRIVSGCDEEKAQEQQTFYEQHIAPMSDKFHLHFTPDFSKLHLAKGHGYKYMNKPFGLRHWMEHALGLSPGKNAPQRLEDSIVILMDPDMILLRPLLHDFRNEPVLWVLDKDQTEPLTKVVRHGFPISQQDGYLNNAWMRLWPMLDGTANLKRPSFKDGPLHFNSGPPYLATVKDMYQMTIGWTKWAPRVLNVSAELFAEMYGLIMATVELDLPFTFIRSIVVSDTSAAKDREGWPLVDALPEDKVCQPPPFAALPIGLHYCKRYGLGSWFLSKYRLKKNIMDCNKELVKVPPADIYPKYNYFITPPLADLSDKDRYDEEDHRKAMTKQESKRMAFMLCHFATAINDGLKYYKARACNGTANFNETYTIRDDPTSW